jgi:hypothetical protein
MESREFAMDDERVRQFETNLWIGGGDVYRERVAEDCQMVVPAQPFLLTGAEAIDAVEGTPRWSSVDLQDLRISRPEEGLIVLAYKAEATRGDEHYEAYCSSTYRRVGHEDWRVVQHQQTIPPKV